MQLLCWLSWSGFELLLAEVKSGCCKLLAPFPTVPAHFQWRSARVTTLCGFHLAHHDLQRDRHGSKQLRCVLRPTSPLGLVGRILLAFPSRKKNQHWICISKKVPGRENGPEKPNTAMQPQKRHVSGCGLRAKMDKFVVQIFRNHPTLAVILRARGCVPHLPLASDK